MTSYIMDSSRKIVLIEENRIVFESKKDPEKALKELKFPCRIFFNNGIFYATNAVTLFDDYYKGYKFAFEGEREYE